MAYDKYDNDSMANFSYGSKNTAPEVETPVYEEEEDSSYINDKHYEELFANRRERYMDQKYESKNEKKISKGAMIAVLVVIFVYFMTAFILNVTGVISLLVMTIMLVPPTIAVIIIYLLSRKKHGDD